MSQTLKLINTNEYLLELDLKNSLYLNQFFEEKDFVDETSNAAKDNDEDELDFAAMTDKELIDYYDSKQGAEVIKFDGYKNYYLNNYIFDYYTKDSLLVIYGKLFYGLSSWADDNTNINMKDLIIDFELRFDTSNARLGQIDILSSIIKANVNNRISCNRPLLAIVNEVVFIPFHFGKTLPKNVKLISSTKKEAFNFNDLQYLDYEWKPKFGGFDGQSSNFSW